MVLFGVALGLTIPACNLAIAEINPEARGSALNLLNFSWSAGAVSCPFLVGAATRVQRVPLLLYVLAGAMLAILLSVSRISFGSPEKTTLSAEPEDLKIDWTRRAILILSALFFLYVGMESAIGGWLASYAKQITWSGALPVMTPSLFYFALMIGRWLAPIVLRWTSEIALARAGIVIACAGNAGLVLARTITALVASATVAGLGLSAVYPITISLLSRRFGRASARAGSITFNMANFGGATLPLLVGYVGHQFGTLKVGLAVPLAAGVLMLGLYRDELVRFDERNVLSGVRQ
jgi:fucose permease